MLTIFILKALQRMTRAESLDEILGHFKAHAVYVNESFIFLMH